MKKNIIYLILFVIFNIFLFVFLPVKFSIYNEISNYLIIFKYYLLLIFTNLFIYNNINKFYADKKNLLYIVFSIYIVFNIIFTFDIWKSKDLEKSIKNVLLLFNYLITFNYLVINFMVKKKKIKEIYLLFLFLIINFIPLLLKLIFVSDIFYYSIIYLTSFHYTFFAMYYILINNIKIKLGFKIKYGIIILLLLFIIIFLYNSFFSKKIIKTMYSFNYVYLIGLIISNINIGIGEEFVYRQFCLEILLKLFKNRIFYPFFLNVFLFFIMHGKYIYDDLSKSIFVLFMAVILTYIYVKFKSFGLNSLVHFFANVSINLLMFIK